MNLNNDTENNEWDFETMFEIPNDDAAKKRANDFLNIGIESEDDNKLVPETEVVVPGILEEVSQTSGNAIKNEITRIPGTLTSSDQKKDFRESLKKEDKQINVEKSGETPDAPSQGPLFISSFPVYSISKIPGTSLCINLPLGFPELISTILKHELLSACPLDHTSRHIRKWTGMISFEKEINGKFNLDHTKESLCLFLHVINEVFQSSFEKNGYYEIPSAIFTNISRRYSFYIKWLLKNGLLECDGTWSDPKFQENCKSFSKGYRFPASVTDLEVFEIKNKKVARLLTKPISKPFTPPEYEASLSILRGKISSIRLPMDAHDLIDSQGYATPILIKNEKLKLAKFEDLEQLKLSFIRKSPGRVFSIFTSLPKYIREKITFGNEALGELDIRSAQPAILYSIFKSYPVPDEMKAQKEKEISLLEELFTTTSEEYGMKKDFYNYLVWEILKRANKIEDYAKATPAVKNKKREWMKKQVMTMFFSDSNWKSKFEIHQLFSEIFPVLTKLIDGYSLSDKKEDQLWFRLQKMESDVVIDGVVPRIADLGFDFFTVHDSICFPESKMDTVKGIWINELAKNGILQPL